MSVRRLCLQTGRYLFNDRSICYRGHMLDERPFTAKRPVGVDATGPDPVAAQRTWAKVWIVHGLLWLALIAYCWTMWVVSGDFTPNTRGRGQEPTWYVILVRCVEVIFGIFITDVYKRQTMRKAM